MLLIRNLQSGKANGPDDISARMLLLCDDSIVLPLKLIFKNILSTGIFPDLWNRANVTPWRSVERHESTINRLKLYVYSTKTPSGNMDYSASLMVCNDSHDRDEIC